MTETTPLQWAALPLKKYATFRGRAPRAEYWWFYLLTMVSGLVASLLDMGLGLSTEFQDGPINLAVMLATLLPWVAVTVRRLHDSDRSGWWLGGPVLLLILVAAMAFATGADIESPGPLVIVGAVLFAIWAIGLFVLMVVPGTEGSNSYGPDPYGVSDLEHIFA